MSNPTMQDVGLTISLVICTRNRSQFLQQMLNSLTRLTTSKVLYELIIVDNGSTDDTGTVLASFSANKSNNVIVVNEPRPGLSVARNTGWKLASGKYVAFTDDDCYPMPNFLDAAIAAFDQHQADYLGGRVLLFDPDDAPVTIQLCEETIYLRPMEYIEAGCIHGANICFKHSVLESLGGFDELLGAGGPLRSGEDTDMMVRASAAGFLGVYDPSLVVSHHHRRRGDAEVLALQRGYTYGRGALAAKAISIKNIQPIYARRFYWRCRTYLRRGQWGELGGELRGFIDYFTVHKFGRIIFGK